MSKGRSYADMARGVRRGESRAPVLNELSQNAGPPQSTLAEQLVNHLTDRKKHHRTQDDETFRLLLREILATESGQIVRTEPLLSDSGVDYKLIYVIVKAGLENLKLDSRQATDSLTAIDFTIKRNPEVLFVDPQFQGPDPQPVGPLYLWLVPKLLALTGFLQGNDIIAGVLRVFATLLVFARKTHARRVNLRPVLKYVKGCING